MSECAFQIRKTFKLPLKYTFELQFFNKNFENCAQILDRRSFLGYRFMYLKYFWKEKWDPAKII